MIIKLSSIAALLLAPTQILAATTVAQVNADIVTLDNSVKTLTTSVQNYHGGLLNETGITLNLALVAANTAKGGTDANALPSTTLSNNEACSVISTVKQTLDIDNPAAVDALIAKKAFFQQSLQDGLVQAGLKLLLSEHLYFSDAILERTPLGALGGANEAVDVISNALQRGINEFAT